MLLAEYTLIYYTQNSLSWLYFQKNKFNLQEKYTPNNYSLENLTASMVCVLNDCRKANITDNIDILNILNTEFIHGNIAFEPVDDKDIPKYPNSGIVKGDSDKNIIRIFVNPTFFNILKKANSTCSDEDTKNLLKDLLSVYRHEFVHMHQTNQEKIPQTGIDVSNMKTRKQAESYLSQGREIDAHAAEVATRLLSTNMTLNQIIKAIRDNTRPLLFDPTYKIYYTCFGMAKDIPIHQRDKDSIFRINIFKRFQKRIFDFLILDHKFITDKRALEINPFN